MQDEKSWCVLRKITKKISLGVFSEWIPKLSTLSREIQRVHGKECKHFHHLRTYLAWRWKPLVGVCLCFKSPLAIVTELNMWVEAHGHKQCICQPTDGSTVDQRRRNWFRSELSIGWWVTGAKLDETRFTVVNSSGYFLVVYSGCRSHSAINKLENSNYLHAK